MPAELTKAREQGAAFVAHGLHALAGARHLALPSFADLGDEPGLDHLELPFAERAFSERHLMAQLDPESDDGCRRPALQHAALSWFCDRLPRGLRVLDLMAGPGLTAAELLGRGFRSYTGIEIGPAIVEHARATVPQAEFELADVAEARSLERSRAFDLALFAYEAVNAMVPAELTALAERLSRALSDESFIAIEVRCPGPWSDGPSRSFAICERGSVFAREPHLLLDERGYLSDRKRFGHRLGVVPLADPERVESVHHTFVWIYEVEELLEIFARERFFRIAEGRPLLELSTDAVESRGNTFLLLRRAPSH